MQAVLELEQARWLHVHITVMLDCCNQMLFRFCTTL
jgi:hypothetical protein